MSTVYYLKWGRLQLDMLDEYNVKSFYTKPDNNSFENKTSTQSIDEQKPSTYENKVQYIKIPFNRSKQNSVSSKLLLEKELVHIDIPEHVHNTLKNMSECFIGKLEEDIYAKEIEEPMLDDESESIVEKVEKMKKEEKTVKEETSEGTQEIKEAKGVAGEEIFEGTQEIKVTKEVEEASEGTQEIKEAKEVAEEETREGPQKIKEEKVSLNKETSKESQDINEEDPVGNKPSEVDDEAKETVTIVAEIKSELGIDSADKNVKKDVKKDVRGEGKMKEDIEKDYDPVEEEYNPINEKEILEKLNPKVEVVDEYDWHEDSYYEQQKIDQLMDHYTYTNENSSNTSNYEETASNHKGVVVENPIKDRGIKSKIKNLFRRKW